MKEINITDIEGFQVGHAQDDTNATGCTVIISKEGAVAGVTFEEVDLQLVKQIY